MSLDILVSEKKILSLPNDQDLGRFVRKEYNKIKEEIERSMDMEYDHCVICGRQSPYTRNTNISDRVGYVDGGGQGCFTPSKCDKI